MAHRTDRENEERKTTTTRRSSIPDILRPNNRERDEVSPSMRIVLLGNSGVGKSAVGNTILGRREFESDPDSATCESSAAQATVSGRSVCVVDTPELFHTTMSPEELESEIGRMMRFSSPGAHAFLIVFRADDGFTVEDQQIPQRMNEMFGEEVFKYSIVLFTHGDQLRGETIEEIIEENSGVRALVDQCGGRFQLFNNTDMNNRDQVNDLLQKIDSMIEQNGGGHYSQEMREDAYRSTRKEEEEMEAERRREKEHTRDEKQRENLNSSGFKDFFSNHWRYFMAAGVGAAILTPISPVVAGVVGLAAIVGAAVEAASGDKHTEEKKKQ